MKNYKKGFTLIELMVAISIIAVLTAVLSANFSDARMQSRDKARMTSLKELQLSVELYKAQNGQYPAQGCGIPGAIWAGPGPIDSWGASCDIYILGLEPDFIPKLPQDPNSENEMNKGFIYITNPTRSAYKIVVHQSIETLIVNSLGDEFSRCPIDCGVSHCPATPRPYQYAVYSSGAECW